MQGRCRAYGRRGYLTVSAHVPFRRRPAEASLFTLVARKAYKSSTGPHHSVSGQVLRFQTNFTIIECFPGLLFEPFGAD